MQQGQLAGDPVDQAAGLPVSPMGQKDTGHPVSGFSWKVSHMRLKCGVTGTALGKAAGPVTIWAPHAGDPAGSKHG